MTGTDLYKRTHKSVPVIPYLQHDGVPTILLLSQKMLRDKVKIPLLMLITKIWIVIPISWNKLLINLTQV